MAVPANLQVRINNKLREGIALLNARYGVKLHEPLVTYNLKGGVAGRANYKDWHIKFNAALLLRNVDEFLERTVPHELAHLGVEAIYPEAHQSRGVVYTRRGRAKRAKRELHGPRWQELMLVLGVKDITRCHSYDVTAVKRKKARYHYRCTGCNATLYMGPKHHAQLVRDPDHRWHRGCKGHRLELTGHTPAQAAAAYAAPKARAPKAPKAGTKLARAYELYKAWQHRYDRNGMIAVFRNELAMTTAGASTYVYQCQKLYNEGVI